MRLLTVVLFSRVEWRGKRGVVGREERAVAESVEYSTELIYELS